MPPWTHLHPLIVHFPIALLVTAPLLVLLGLLWPGQRTGIHFAALILLVLGTGSAALALATGQAASGLAQRTPELRETLLQHQAYAQRASCLFAALTLGFLCLWLIPLLRKTAPGPRMMAAAWLIWLATSALGLWNLARAGQLGGRMVHELGTHAIRSDLFHPIRAQNRGAPHFAQLVRWVGFFESQWAQTLSRERRFRNWRR